jgi:CRP-like cAMP-binding protein
LQNSKRLSDLMNILCQKGNGIDEEKFAHKERLQLEAKRIGVGKCFGELSLIQSKPRAATISCLEDSHFAILHKDGF